MKKIFLMITLTTFSCQGMAYIGLVSGLLGHDSTTQQNYQEEKHWVEYMQVGEYEKAYDELQKNRRQTRHAYFLHQCVEFNMPISFIEKIMEDGTVYYLNADKFINGMLMAIRKGDVERFDLLRSTWMISAEQIRNMVLIGRLDAATGRPIFVKKLLEYGHEVKKRMREMYPNVAEKDLSNDVKHLISISDLSKPHEKPRRSILWDDSQRKIIERGSKEHSFPLHAAVDARCDDSVILLLRFGADPHALDHDAESALALAKKKRCTAIEGLLTLFAFWKDKLHTFDATKQPLSLRQVIKRCPALASCCIKDTEGNTLLHKAIQWSDKELAHLLLRLEPLLREEKNNAGLVPDLSLLVTKEHQEEESEIPSEEEIYFLNCKEPQ